MKVPGRDMPRPRTPGFDAALMRALSERMREGDPVSAVAGAPVRTTSRLPRRALALSLGLIAVVAGAAIAGDALPDKVPLWPRGDDPLVFSALQAPPSPASREVTARFTGNPLAATTGMVVEGIREAGPTAQEGLFIAPTDRGWICIVRTSPPVSGCVPEQWLRNNAMANITYPAPNTMDIAGVASDGYTTATFRGSTVPVERNGYLFETVPKQDGTLELKGEGLPTVTLDIDAPPKGG